MAMLERVEVDVIEVALIVGIVANQMLPVTPLPNAALTSGRKGRRSAFVLWQAPWENEFDRLPAQRKARITRRQRPQTVHVFGQHHPRINMKGLAVFDRPYRSTQQLNFPHQQIAGTVMQVHGKN
jgi:hypothetical protein